MDQTALDGMPDPGVLRLHAGDGQVLVTCGRSVLYRYDTGDTGMRNLAIVALTDAGRRVDEVAAVFGLSATYVSILRGGPARTGRPPWCVAAAARPSCPSGRWPRRGPGPVRAAASRASPSGSGWPSR